MKNSNLFTLNFKDFLKGLIIAILAPVLLVIQQSLDSGQFIFNWKQIVITSISAGLAYLIKNFISDSKGNVLGAADAIGGGGIKNPPK